MRNGSLNEFSITDPVNVPSGSCEEIISRANNAIAKIAGVGRLRM